MMGSVWCAENRKRAPGAVRNKRLDEQHRDGVPGTNDAHYRVPDDGRERVDRVSDIGHRRLHSCFANFAGTVADVPASGRTIG